MAKEDMNDKEWLAFLTTDNDQMWESYKEYIKDYDDDTFSESATHLSEELTRLTAEYKAQPEYDDGGELRNEVFLHFGAMCAFNIAYQEIKKERMDNTSGS